MIQFNRYAKPVFLHVHRDMQKPVFRVATESSPNCIKKGQLREIASSIM